MTENTAEHDRRPTPDAAFESLTGFDEIAIAKYFGAEITTMRERPFFFMRALLFVAARREGKTDAEAYRHAMEMPTGAVNDSFRTGDDESDYDADQDAEGNAP